MNDIHQKAIAEGRYRFTHLAGQCRTGSDRTGYVVHLLPEGNNWKALCGTEPGKRSAGWSEYTDQELTCVDCKSRFTQLQAPERGQPDDIFGTDEIIFSYLREDALEDGVLVDVSEMAKEAGFRFPVAITQDLHATITPNDTEKSYGQSYDGRLWDVLWMAIVAGRQSEASRIHYNMILAEGKLDASRLKQRTLTLLADVGPGDHGEPVITIGFPSDF